MNFTDFKNTKTVSATSSQYELYEHLEEEGILKQYVQYGGGFEIAELTTGQFYLILGRSDYMGKLEDLIVYLWDFAKYELGDEVTKEEIKSDLDSRIAALKSELNVTCNLDEIALDSLPNEQKFKVKYLMAEVSEFLD